MGAVCQEGIGPEPDQTPGRLDKASFSIEIE